MRGGAFLCLVSLMATPLLASSISAQERTSHPSAQPPDCLRYFELNDTIGEGDNAGQMIGYFDRVIHHSGLRDRHFVFAFNNRADRVVTVRGGKLTAQITDPSDQNRLRTFFAKHTVLDQSDMDRPELAGIALADPPSNLAQWGCGL